VTRPFVHYRDKQLGDLTEILNEQMLVSRRPLIGESFERLNYESAEMEIIDHQPAGVLIRIQAPNWFIEWGFWAGIKGITTSVSYDLESLEETEELVEYGYALPKVAQGGLKAQIGGGWMDPEVDLLPGVPDYSLSLRQGLLLNLDEFQLGIASRDARVLYLENLKPDGLNPVLGLFNNFPLSWNRNEANDGWVTFHLNSQPLTKKSGVRDLTELTTSAAEPLILGHTWFRTKPASESVFELKGKGVSLLAVHPCTDGEGFLIRIQNHDPVKDLKAVLRSPFFNDRGQIYESSLKEERGQAVKVKGDSVRLKLGPREIRTLRMDWLQQEKGDD